MNNLGRNKGIWLKKQGCVFIDEPKEWYPDGKRLTQVYTARGEYVGLADLGKNEDDINFIYKHRLTNLMSVNVAKGLPLEEYSCNAVSVGFNEKEQTWYGWTHRGFGKFYVGYTVAPGSMMDNGDHKYPFTVETLEQAKQLAIDIAEYLD